MPLYSAAGVFLAVIEWLVIGNTGTYDNTDIGGTGRKYRLTVSDALGLRLRPCPGYLHFYLGHTLAKASPSFAPRHQAEPLSLSRGVRIIPGLLV